MLNLNVSNKEELCYEFNLGQHKARLTLPAIDPELVDDPADPPCGFIDRLSILIKDCTAVGFNSPHDSTNLSNEAITDTVDSLMIDNLIPCWTIRFREDTTIDIFWYRHGVPDEWKTMVPPAGTKRMRMCSITNNKV